MKFLLIASFVLAVVVAETCVPGSYFQNKCNWCRCLRDGRTLACTDNLCPEDARVSARRVCEPRTTFNVACNTCRCTDDGLDMVCTKMLCDDDEVPEKSEAPCTPGKLFKISCNTCRCMSDGKSFACTDMICADSQTSHVKNALNWGPLYTQGDRCTPGKVFYSECNQCICSKSGKSAFCTFLMC